MLIQFEDFANHAAFHLLHKYRDKIPTFNDDIQGTAAVALAGLFSALRVTGGKLKEQKFCSSAPAKPRPASPISWCRPWWRTAPSEAEARGRIWLVDSRGLVVKDRAGLNAQKLRYAHAHAPVGDFLSAIKDLKPTAIIGVAAVGGTFTPEVLRTMAEINKQPIIFALSNPTSKAECSAEEAYRHTGGRALFACGSPYDPVTIDGKTFVPRQGNNSYIFPGVGLGAIASETRLVTDEMFMAAAHTLARDGQRSRPQAGQPLSGAAANPRGFGAGSGRRLPRLPTNAASPPDRRRTTCSRSSSRKCTTRATERMRTTNKAPRDRSRTGPFFRPYAERNATLRHSRGAASYQADNRRNGEQDDRHEEHQLGGFHGHASDTAKAEHGGDQGDDQKCNGPT